MGLSLQDQLKNMLKERGDGASSVVVEKKNGPPSPNPNRLKKRADGDGIWILYRNGYYWHVGSTSPTKSPAVSPAKPVVEQGMH